MLGKKKNTEIDIRIVSHPTSGRPCVKNIEMENIYTNIKGTTIPEQRIQDALDAIGKTEREVLDFLGDYGLSPGALFYFVEMMATQMEWVRDRRGYNENNR